MAENQPTSKAAGTIANAGVITREALMDELKIAPDLVRKFERLGMPSIRIGNQCLYHVPAVIRWMLRHQQTGKRALPKKGKPVAKIIFPLPGGEKETIIYKLRDQSLCGCVKPVTQKGSSICGKCGRVAV